MTAKILEFVKGTWSRLGQRPDRIELSVQKSIRIGEKALATVVNFEGETLLLGVTGHSVTVLWRRGVYGQDHLPVRGTIA